MTKKRTKKPRIVIIAVALIIAVGATITIIKEPEIVHAADSNFADGITVDSTGDGSDANLADSICDDGSGNCTLRAAIEESNDESGTQTIKFNITGTADFTNGGQNGYTMQPGSVLPTLSDTVIIDGYSQPGSQANTAISPSPLNGRLLVEIDGGDQSFTAFEFSAGADNSRISGMVINSFQGNAVRILGANSLVVQGNYIGTDYSGMLARPNGADNVNSSTAVSIGENGLETLDTTTNDTLIGGLDPEDRNIISGNYGGGLGIGAVDTTILGNYVGVARDGVTDLGNSYGTGVTTGGFTIDYADGVFIGRPDLGGVNVISGNATGGIQPDYSTDVIIDSNYIGTDYTGSAAVPNDLSGVSINQVSVGTAIVRNNRIRFNQERGVMVTGTGTSVNISNNNITDNNGIGIDLQTSNNRVIGNIISNNHGAANVSISGTSGVVEKNVLQDNKIGTKSDGTLDPSYTQNMGVSIIGNVSDTLIGGNNPNQGNIIAGHNGGGVVTSVLSVTGFGSLSPTSNSFLSNRIYSNNAGNIYGLAIPGIGIDLLNVAVNGSFIPQSINDEGPTLNDPGDTDTGANNYLNFPVVNSTNATTGNLNVNFDLDVDNSASSYRVEFFANNTADPSGHGEGQIYLGSTNVSGSATGATTNLTIPSSFTSGSYAISATTTEIDDSTDGFGNTSEFGAVLGNQTVLAAISSTTGSNNSAGGSLANTGQNIAIAMWAGGGLLLSGVAITLIPHLRHSKR